MKIKRYCPRGCGKKVIYKGPGAEYRFACPKCKKQWESLQHYENSLRKALKE